jgi:hypothetical protein
MPRHSRMPAAGRFGSRGMLCTQGRIMSDVINRLRYMPIILRTVCLTSLGLGVMLPISLCFPANHVQVFDDNLTVGQLWSQGYAPFFFICSGALLIQGIGLIRGVSWSRWLVVLQYVFFIPLVVVYMIHHDGDHRSLVIQTFVTGVAWAAFFYWYLFQKQKSQFNGDPSG